MKLKMESEASERKEKIEAEERRELRERELKKKAEALEKKERQEAEALEKRERREEQDRQALEKKEALALVTSVKAFSPYFGAAPVTVWTDHSPLRYIESMSNQNAKLMRWSFELQRNSLDVKQRPGKLNLLPDLLSRPASA